MPVSSSGIDSSLYELLITQLADDVPIIRCTKAVLVHLSHTLEDLVLRHKLPAMLFTGFQESSHWRKETERYREIAEVAQQVCIFAGKPLPPESDASQLHIELANGDPLRQEWFLVILSSRFSVLLCGQDSLVDTKEEATREFDTIITFDSDVISRTLDVLENVIEHYRPHQLEAVRSARQRFTPNLPDENILLQFTVELIGFEEKLNSRLRRQQRLIDTVLDTVSYHLYLTEVDDSGNLTRVYNSLNMHLITGFTYDEVAQPGFWLQRVHPDDRDKAALIENRLKDQFTDVVEYRFRHASGHFIWLRNHSRIFWDGNQQKWLIYGVLQDITPQREIEDMRRMQEELQLALEAERQMSAVKSYFMYTVSHEFRTPLATILSSTELLQNYSERMDETARANKLKSIRDQVLHLNAMLEDITSIINEQINSLGFKPMAVNLQEFVNYIIRDLEIVTGTDHYIQYTYEGEAGRYLFDPKLVRQILTNLLSNALKYSPDAETVDCIVNVSNGWITLRVVDHGIGIPEEDQPFLFEPFHRASNVGAIGGVGLGLKIVYDCVKAHKGTIHLFSKVNEGTTFIVRLPTADTTA